MKQFAVGDKMPNLAFTTASGLKSTVREVQSKDTFFVVLRYIGCTLCRYDIHILQKSYSEFLKKDAQIYVVVQSSCESVNESLQGETLPFEIICDLDLVFYTALQVKPAEDKSQLAPDYAMDAIMEKVSKAKKAGFEHGKYEGIEEQLPAVFLIDKSGTVKYVNYGKHVVDIPTIEEMLSMI